MKLDLKTILRIFFTAFVFYSTAGLQAKTLYWVGGSGSWGEVNHWSGESGGTGGFGFPTADDDVVINNQSGAQVVEINRDVHVNSLNVTSKVTVNGDGNRRLIINEAFYLDGLVTNNFKGSVHLLNRHSLNSYQFFGENSFVNERSNIFNVKEVDSDQALAVTSISIDTTLQTCPGSNDGKLKVTPIDGVGPFTYFWTFNECPGAVGDTDSAVNVCNGAHSLLIIDAADPGNPSPFTINMGPSPINAIILDTGDETCQGDADGSITAFASGGTAPLQFSWSNGGGTSLSPTGLAPGTYQLTVTDDNGCVSPNQPTTTVNPPPPIVLSALAVDVPDCGAVGCTEDVTFSASGGNGPPVGGWVISGTNPVIAAPINLVDICPGDVFEVATVDALGCPQTLIHTATVPPTVTVAVTEDQPVTCLGVEDGAATASAAGGTGPYGYVWLDIVGNPVGATQTGLAAGTYRVEATDQTTLCKDTGIVIITSPTPQVVDASISASSDATCLTATNGDATASATGGTPGYTFTWFDVPSAPFVGPTVGSLPPGSYNVEARDIIGCVDTVEVIITAPAISPVTASATNTTLATCLVAANGEATASGAGGTGSYDFDWYNVPGAPITTPVVSGLPIGTYNVGVTDQDGCADTAQVTITAPAVSPVVASVTLDRQITCVVANNGEATASGSGGNGIPNYIFDWYDVPGAPIATASVTSLPVGIYNVGVTDQDGCADTAQVTVTPPVISVVVASVAVDQQITCLTASNGEATASGSGGNGVPNYLFDWYDVPGAPLNTASVTSLPVGTYNVGVTDQDGCADTAQVIITPSNPDPVTVSVTKTDVVCLGLPTGGAEASASGGAPGYSFEWYNIIGQPTTPVVSNLNIGTYFVEVTDDDNCKDTAQVDILAPNPPVITTTLNPVVEPDCDGLTCNGSATATASGGRGPYDYSWFDAPLAPSGQSISNLCFGNYNLAVVDQDGCRDTALLAFTPPMTITLDSKTDIVCGGVCTGVIDVSGSGGNGVFVYDWYDMTGTPTFNAANDSAYGVCAGTYHIAISDGSPTGCFDTLEVTIIEPTPMTINVDRKDDNLCFGDCNGQIDVSLTGGTLPVVALWTDSNGIAPVVPGIVNLTGLCNGLYIYQATDDLNCVLTDTISITSPNTSVNFNLSPLCPTDSDANVQAEATGGTAPYVYTWLDPVPGNINDNIQVGLLPGTYDLEVVDFNGCTDTFTLSYAIPLPISSSAIITDAQCEGVCNGEIDVTITGGLGIYDVVWYDMIGTPITEDLVGVCAGTYNLAIEDGNGCRDTLKSVAVDGATAITTAVTEIQATCDGLCDGKVWVTASNGSPDYIYNWYDAPPANVVQDTAFNMCVGNYNVEITDQQGCVDTVLAAVTAPVVVSASFANTTQNLCAQDCNGATEVVITGGVGPMQIDWLNVPGNPVTAAVADLCNGSYYVEVTDDNDCKDRDTIDITSQSGTVTFNTVDPSCGGYRDGSITAVPVGVPANYTPVWYTIQGGPVGLSVSGLSAGTYQMEMTDANNCIDTFDVTLVDPFPAIDLQTSSQVVSCFGFCDGKAWATPAGGAAPFQYSWYSPGANSIIDTASNLCVGNYFVAVVDNNGCEDTASVAITEPFNISLSSSSKAPCFGVCDGNATAVVVGEGRPFTYKWEGSLSTDSALTDLCAATYKVIVTNATGCVDSAEVILNENTEITAAVTSSRATCTNFTNGSAAVAANGGVLPYQYLWTNGAAYTSVSPNPTNLAVGNYYIVVSDNIGCTYQDSVTITEVKVVSPNAGSDATLCEGDSVTLVGSGGVSYLWSTGDTTSTIKVSPTGTVTYTLTVMDSICTDDDNVTVTLNNNPTATVTADQVALLEGFSMTTTIRGEGAGDGGAYDWVPPTGLSDPTSPTPTVSPLASTRYYLTVTDANGCKDTSSVLIDVIESIEYSDGISPNGDGINDNWPIVFIENFPEAIVEIYNRWGQLLFHSLGYKERWDGTYNGKELPVGTYYFVIDLGTDLPKYTGPITIFR